MAAKKDAGFDEIVKNGIDWQSRRIYWGGECDEDDSASEVHWENVERVIRAIHIMETSGTTPIELHMDSGGGSIVDMLRLVDEIEACSVPVHFVGGGMVASAAAVVMSVCDFRSLHKGTTVMVHDGSSGANGSWTDLKIEKAWIDWLMERCIKIMVENSRMPESFWREIGQRDLFLSAEEAVFIGIADMVISAVDRSSMREDRMKRLAMMPDSGSMKKVVNELRRRINSPLYKGKM